MTKPIIVIAILILLIVLALKFSSKIIKVIIYALFIGFVIYVLTGTDIISQFINHITSPNIPDVIKMLKL